MTYPSEAEVASTPPFGPPLGTILVVLALALSFVWLGLLLRLAVNR